MQVELEDSSKEKKTSFACDKGLFQFNWMPIGLSNAMAVFQVLMNIVLQGQEEFATTYLDDSHFLRDTGRSSSSYSRRFNRQRKHGLKLKLMKCSFVKEKTDYLGFIINENGISPNPKKVDAIYFHIRKKKLIDLARKYASFKWTRCCHVFDFIRESLTVLPLLAYPDTNKPYILNTDANNNGIRVCFTQRTDGGEDQPI